MARHHPADLVYAAIARARGIKYPLRALDAARAAGVGPATALAFLEKESGGRNVWGHDAPPNGGTSSLGGRTVTEEAYRGYKLRRDVGGKGKGGMQGVGPLQLTWYSFQDDADKLGGCWVAKNSLRVGYRLIAGYIDRLGYWGAAKAYNGAAAYADDFMKKRRKWRILLFGRS